MYSNEIEGKLFYDACADKNQNMKIDQENVDVAEKKGKTDIKTLM